jgi:thiol-disulfide isomerase/thioredoxin
MSPSLAVVVVVLIAAFGLAYVINRLIALRAGLLKDTTSAAGSDTVDTSDLGLSDTGPTIVHFSAVWCGPCAGVRRVVDQVCDELPAVAHVEIDMDANPAAARRLSVLSLPPHSCSMPTAASATGSPASRPPLTCGRRSTRCWLDHHVIG